VFPQGYTQTGARLIAFEVVSLAFGGLDRQSDKPYGPLGFCGQP
jgi:hypothetical protein